jgi:hypothetical protein
MIPIARVMEPLGDPDRFATTESTGWVPPAAAQDADGEALSTLQL